MDDSQDVRADYEDDRPEDELKDISGSDRQPPEAPEDSRRGRHDADREGGERGDGTAGNEPSGGEGADPGLGTGAPRPGGG